MLGSQKLCTNIDHRIHQHESTFLLTSSTQESTRLLFWPAIWKNHDQPNESGHHQGQKYRSGAIYTISVCKPAGPKLKICNPLRFRGTNNFRRSLWWANRPSSPSRRSKKNNPWVFGGFLRLERVLLWGVPVVLTPMICRLNRICGAQGLRQQQALQDSGGIRLQKRLAEYGISRLPSQGVRQKCEPNFHCTVR